MEYEEHRRSERRREGRPESEADAIAAFARAGALEIPADPAERAAWIVAQGPDGIEQLMLALHGELAPHVDNAYRRSPIQIGPDVGQACPHHRMVPGAMRRVFAAITESVAQDPSHENLQRLGQLATNVLGEVHPFRDGNGRTSRALGYLIAAGPADQQQLAALTSGDFGVRTWRFDYGIAGAGMLVARQKLKRVARRSLEVAIRERDQAGDPVPDAIRNGFAVRIPSPVLDDDEVARDASRFSANAMHDYLGEAMVTLAAVRLGLRSEFFASGDDGRPVLDWRAVRDAYAEREHPGQSVESEFDTARMQPVRMILDTMTAGGPEITFDGITETVGDRAQRIAQTALGVPVTRGPRSQAACADILAAAQADQQQAVSRAATAGIAAGT